MDSSPTYLLDQYIIGKDQDKYQILEAIYDRKAEVEFEINTDAITFPSKISGNTAIAQTLSADFNKKYEKVRTYYLSKNISGNNNILEQPWLVVMKEISTERTRIGTGYYNWEFTDCNGSLKIIKHKIYIHAMLELHDTQSRQLMEIQAKLHYPWVDKRVAVNILEEYGNLADIIEYLAI